MQKEPIRFDAGDRKELAQFDEAIAFDRQIDDAPMSATGGEAYKTIKGAEPRAVYQLDGQHVGLDAHASLGSEAWRQVYLEYWHGDRQVHLE